jgi:hypothetical protein
MTHTYWFTLIATIVVLALVHEVGFLVGRRMKDEIAATKREAVEGVGTAMLALLGLLLGFTFSLSDDRYTARKRTVLDDVNAIGTTYLRAKMLPAPHDQHVQELLREYVAIRTQRPTRKMLPAALQRTAELQGQLWDDARAVAALDTHSHITALYIESLNRMIDLNNARVTIGIYQTLPPAITRLLYIAAILSIGVFGYGLGLRRRRAQVPLTALVIAIALVLTVIVDYNRVGDPIAKVGLQGYKDLQKQMATDIRATR